MKTFIPLGLLGIIGVCVAAPVPEQQESLETTSRSNGPDENSTSPLIHRTERRNISDQIIKDIGDRKFISLKKRQGGGGREGGGGSGGGSGGGNGGGNGGGSRGGGSSSCGGIGGILRNREQDGLIGGGRCCLIGKREEDGLIGSGEGCLIGKREEDGLIAGGEGGIINT